MHSFRSESPAPYNVAPPPYRLTHHIQTLGPYNTAMYAWCSRYNL